MGAALSSVLNGGIYYKPHLVDSTTDSNGKVTTTQPKVVKQKVISREASKTIQSLMEYTVQKNYRIYGMSSLRPQFSIGGKTGTAEISKPEGGYYSDRFNGMFMGFVGGDEAQYVIVVRVDDPKISGYAGARAAAPIFSSLANMLIDNFDVTPKGQ
jgi:cell division protein FtsI/penicillin-binding protein 2